MIDAADLFSGPGGLTLGMKQAGVNTVCAVEIDPYCVQTFGRHTPTANIVAGDIRKADFSAYRGKIGLVYGGPPCQPFSSGGLRAAADDERDMLPWFIRAIRDCRPFAFLMENVPGLATGDRAAYLAGAIRELESFGYQITWAILNAADFGVPQKRRRLFVVGMRDRRFKFPKETHGPGRELPQVTVGEVLPPYQIGEPNPSVVVCARNPDIRPSPYDGHIFNGGGRPIDRGQPCHTILASAGGNKTHFFDGLGIVPTYHRHLMAGGVPWVGTVPGTRRLTVLESAIIQTFPPGMVFCGPRSAQYRQVGDAVPPKLAAVLGRSLLQQMMATTPEPDDDPRRASRALQQVLPWPKPAAAATSL